MALKKVKFVKVKTNPMVSLLGTPVLNPGAIDTDEIDSLRQLNGLNQDAGTFGTFCVYDSPCVEVKLKNRKWYQSDSVVVDGTIEDLI